MGIMTNVFAVIMSVLLDWAFGEPVKYHPLVGFGHLANRVEAILNKARLAFFAGMLAWCLLVLPFVYLVYQLDVYLNQKGISSFWLNMLFGWLAIGHESLQYHGRAIQRALQAGYLSVARKNTALIVSRDTEQLDEPELSRASVESILENGSDAVIAPMFWLLLGGAPLVVLYRLSNTLDAMWGYHTKRFDQFGKFSARVDDVLNFIPARITALLYAMGGNFKQAMAAWKQQKGKWYSPNAGVVMAAGAGALDLQLGGDAVYHGQLKKRPLLGDGKTPLSQDILDSLALVRQSTRLFLMLITLFGLLWGIYLKPEMLTLGIAID